MSHGVRCDRDEGDAAGNELEQQANTILIVYNKL